MPTADPRVVWLLGALALGVVAAACGGGDETTADASESGIDGAVGAAEELANDAVENTAAEAGATVEIDGITHTFRALEAGPDDDFYSFCTEVAGSLQGVMQLVDDFGERVEGGEISFLLLEPGGAFEDTGDPPEFTVQLPDPDGSVPLSYDATEIDVPADRRSASGSFTAAESFTNDEVSGTVNISC